MCKYKYTNKGDKLNNKPCVYPDFFVKNESVLAKKLPIDKKGLCIFHSKDKGWKEANKFKEYFSLLITSFPLINRKNDQWRWKYDFIGFVFTEELIVDNMMFENQIDFSNCIFNEKVLFKEIQISSLDFQYSHFKDVFSFKNNVVTSNIYASKAIFENGIRIKDCELNGNNYFEGCQFNNINNSSKCEIGIEKNKKILSLSFENSNIKPRVSVDNSTIEQEFIFDQCNIYDEFILENNTINGLVSFRETDFLLSENLSSEYSSVTIGNNKINKTGKIIFNGKKPMDDMVKGELAFYFKEMPLGLISFENFDLNKLYLDNKLKLLEIERKYPNIISIASSCSKYYCMTDYFTIESSSSNQKLLLDLTDVFCNFFKLKESTNLGIEIVEQNHELIKYYYFTDERITKVEFYNKIKRNETKIWQTLSNLSELVNTAIVKNNIDEIDIIFRLDNWWKMLAYRIFSNRIKIAELTNITNSIALELKNENQVIGFFKQMHSQFQIIIDSKEPLTIQNMGKINFNNTTINGGVHINDYSQKIIQFTNENNLDKEQQDKLTEILREVNKLPNGEKENKFIELCKEWLPTFAGMLSEAFKPYFK